MSGTRYIEIAIHVLLLIKAQAHCLRVFWDKSPHLLRKKKKKNQSCGLAASQVPYLQNVPVALCSLMEKTIRMVVIGAPIWGVVSMKIKGDFFIVDSFFI
jgi:hypothetical protein